ncbi:MAG: CinA family nicotinamide mononucleotide deamidase-related protein [Desulfobacteraceae bacterium]|nr:MAG: CinA family nicotinamide mononucleotide deamidase-related protein [Desulfobacteraceae bacterium]
MIAEILSTGDEIRSGALVDSNSAHIAEVLEEVGLEVTRHSTVGDDLNAISSIIKEIGARADVAVVTGGLGPTTDDLTTEAAAMAADTELYEDKAALLSIENFFKKRQRLMNPLNKKQALLPKGSKCLENPAGTAPGFAIRIGNCLFFFLPGVPSEMKKMLSEKVLPEIAVLWGGAREYSFVRSISTFGLTEAAVNENLMSVIDAYPGIRLGLRATFPEIHVKLYARGKDEKKILELLERATGSVLTKLGNRALSTKGEPMELVVGNLLKTKKSTLAVAESCTGGLVSNMLTNISGSSDYFLFSGITYSNDSKVKLLGVQQAVIDKYGAVHEETAKEMAVCARRIAGATYGLSTSGIAGPAGGMEGKPIGTICIGLATPVEVKGFRFVFQFGDRLMNKKVFAVTALDQLRRELL